MMRDRREWIVAILVGLLVWTVLAIGGFVIAELVWSLLHA